MSDRQLTAPPASSLCVGRTQELDHIRSQWELACAGQGSFCSVVGDTGSGKSTLLHAFVSSLNSTDPDVVIAWASCDKQIGNLRPLAPWTDILRSLTGTVDFDDPGKKSQNKQSVVTSIRSAISELAPDVIELLIPGVGLAVRSAKLLKRSSLGERLSLEYSRPEEDAVAADRSRIHDQYIAIVEQVLEKAPLIIVMDDIDCIDETSLLLLDRMAAKTRNRKIMFLVASGHTSSLIDPHPTMAQIAKNIPATAIDLDSLGEQRREEFTVDYLQLVAPGVSDRFVRQLFGHTGGNPLFLAELIEHLRKKGDISAKGDHWQVSQELNWQDVPRKIDLILTEQFQELDSELADVLQAGSVEGDQFSIEVVAAALEKSHLSVARLLARRCPRNLVVPLVAPGQGQTTVFKFSYTLARQHFYSTIDPMERRYLHHAVANQLEIMAGDLPELVAGQLAYQFEQAGVVDKAGFYYELAASRAITTCSISEASTHLQRALELLSGRLDQMRIKHQLAKLEMMLGRIQQSVDLYKEARTIAEQEQAGELTTFLADEALASVRINDFESAWDAALLAEHRARKESNSLGLLSALQTLALIHSKNGQYEEALNLQNEAMTLAEEQGSDNLIAEALTKRGWYLKELGRYQECCDDLTRSLAIQNEDQPNYSTLAYTYNALADMYISQENYPEARKNLLLAIESWRQFDRIADIAVGIGNLANLYNREGLFEEALKCGREAFEEDLLVLGADHPDLAFSLSCIGESLIGLGDFESAVETLAKAYDLRKRHHVPESNLAWSSWLLGRAQVESGIDVQEGRQHIKDARTVLIAMGAAVQSELNDIDTWLADQAD